MLRLGIIGCGRVTSMFHLKAIDQIPDITVTAVSDVNKERMGEMEESCGSPDTYLDYRDLLSDPDIDAVAVNTPPRFHAPIVLDALNAGKHVLCEKPLAETLEDCYKIREVQQGTGLTVLPAHNYAFTPSLVKMSKHMRTGVIGEISGVDVAFRIFSSLIEARQISGRPWRMVCLRMFYPIFSLSCIPLWGTSKR